VRPLLTCFASGLVPCGSTLLESCNTSFLSVNVYSGDEDARDVFLELLCTSQINMDFLQDLVISCDSEELDEVPDEAEKKGLEQQLRCLQWAQALATCPHPGFYSRGGKIAL